MKILHAADLHLDSPLAGQTAQLRKQLLSVPEKIVALCQKHGCDMLLLAGDMFDGEYTREGFLALHNALSEVKIPVFITPGNHDFCTPGSPWMKESWPENVHIFTRPAVESVALPELDCRVYGAGFVAMDCPSLLEKFSLEGEEKYHIGILHGDPMQKNSPYNPITQPQVAATGLNYLALGHVHKGGQLQAGKTLCAWPGCPMGRGYDETGDKGVLLVTVEDTVTAEFVALNYPKFYDLETEMECLPSVLPAVGSDDFYRITLVGECEKPDLQALRAEYSRFPNLELRDRTQRPVDVWASMGEDSLEGSFFHLLHEELKGDEEENRIVTLAAKIARKILDGGEVVLP